MDADSVLALFKAKVAERTIRGVEADTGIPRSTIGRLIKGTARQLQQSPYLQTIIDYLGVSFEIKPRKRKDK